MYQAFRIIGIDPGTENFGYALLEGSINAQEPDRSTCVLRDCGVWKSGASEGDVRTRIDRLTGRLHGYRQQVAAAYIASEDFTEQGRAVGKTYKEMSWLTESIRQLGREPGVTVDLYENADWKQFLMGARQATKQMVQHYIRHSFPQASEVLNGFPDHTWDAAAIACTKFKRLIVEEKFKR